jgi:hypothetical protein
VGVTGLVDFPAETERKAVLSATELMVQLVAVHTFSVHCIGIRDRQLKVLGCYA